MLHIHMRDLRSRNVHGQDTIQDPNPGRFYSKVFFVCPHMCCPQLDIVLLSCGNTDMGTHGKLCRLMLQKHHQTILGKCSQFKGESLTLWSKDKAWRMGCMKL